MGDGGVVPRRAEGFLQALIIAFLDRDVVQFAQFLADRLDQTFVDDTGEVGDRHPGALTGQHHRLLLDDLS